MNTMTTTQSITLSGLTVSLTASVDRDALPGLLEATASGCTTEELEGLFSQQCEKIAPLLIHAQQSLRLGLTESYTTLLSRTINNGKA